MDLPFLKISRCDTFRLFTFPRKWWGVLQLVDELSSCHDAVSGSHIEQVIIPNHAALDCVLFDWHSFSRHYLR